ncbi:AT-rich interactive domain-containing protein 5-like [Silene latifolia]|uniref:AT-rich interactive domain-containing protein 5-like n=1 Tax=Silene latifolia TaxID=37657 RepID=UPI003D7826C8
MGNDDTEMAMGDARDEEAELDEGDTPSPVDEFNHGSPNVEENGHGNGNGDGHPGMKAVEEKLRAVDGSFQNKIQNGGSSVEATPARISGRLLARSLQDPASVRFSDGKKRLKRIDDDEEAGTKEEQAEFMKELVAFYKERRMDIRPPKFYGEPLNLLKLWRLTVQLGGYDRVTFYKLWRQIGESFHPPKTCTTISWTFRIFYEKSLLEYEKHKIEMGEVEFPDAPTPELASGENEGGAITSSGRVRRESATRAMQGWHSQRQSGYGEDGEPIVKDKNPSSSQKREKHLKNIGVKQRKPNNMVHEENDMQAELNNQLVATIIDVGPPADWVKINVRESKDCFEVYVLVPGLLREEVRVQSDASGRVVITGTPEQLDNPWGITPFKKIVNLPARIDTLHTSAVVSLHGRLFVRVPFAPPIQ